jgi:hypothetical protein
MASYFAICEFPVPCHLHFAAQVGPGCSPLFFRANRSSSYKKKENKMQGLWWRMFDIQLQNATIVTRARNA